MNTSKQWASYGQKYAERAPREKWILLFAALAVVYFLADTLWITPSLSHYKTVSALHNTKRAELAQLTQQNAVLSEQMRAQLQQNQSAIAAAQEHLGAAGEQLAAFEKTLVPAENMTAFLKSVMPGQGIEVIALRTLPPEPLVLSSAATSAPGANPASTSVETAADSQSGQPNLYKHGVELRLAGSYTALLGYVSRLEQAPQKVLWGRVSLEVNQHPRTELTLIMYTLSLDKSWIAV